MENQPAEERTRDSVEQMDINSGGLTDPDANDGNTDGSGPPLLGGLLSDTAGGVESDYDDTTDRDPGTASGSGGAGDVPPIPSPRQG